MQLEVHAGSLVAGAAIGAVMSALGTLVLGPAIWPPLGDTDNTVLLSGLERCREKQPLYVTRVGAITSVKCNGHKEGVPQ